jgi:hypothetical protein
MKHVRKPDAPTRIAIVLWGALALANACAARPAPSGIASCPRIADDKQRLACFDREFALQGQGTRAPEVPKPAAAPAPARKELTPEQRMGLSPQRILQLQHPAAAPSDLREMTAKIRDVSSSPDGRLSFILANGQVWRQVVPDPQFRVRSGDTVHITRGWLGSYFLSLNAHVNTRVSRAR